ncbi:hypothetical protein [Neisseria sp. DTU_2021_1001991_1_SI_NGA_ILE_055]|uniref:hypothetical protein n=1 Tax=Neisseria sp. DTU_2021_1001991_1_SI_NGA_ILE_055 TaxID=3077590 RepID=UPI0028E2E532|nr:hypothetical protein [Neisseria sp. DTU_2021_1001991_1_SI_NGA_ILE_055]WNS83779.1 hypothetical protein RRV97_01210 [Neisseria sp. DTU_2021_1001991_1_SI_NGA_ILE_055]
MNQDQKKEIKTVITLALDIADQFWKESGGDLEKEESAKILVTESLSVAMDSITTSIPNHQFISEYESKNTELIALVADMRKSTEHAKSANSIMHPLRRIFLETSALLPAMEKVVNFRGGQVTEYLGDGILGFFSYKKRSDIYKAYNAANDIITDMKEIVNDIIHERYRLPKDINIGVGLAKSQTIIYAAGLPDAKHPKAFGSCVYDATKLSCEMNKIGVSPSLKALWPKKKGGTLKFESKKFRGGCDGFLIKQKN